MPKLLAFAPCEKIIIDDKGNASLIVLLQDIAIEVPSKTEIPKNAVTPKEWAVFTMWRPLPEDQGKMFEQIVQMLWPDGTEFKRAQVKFAPEQKKIHQNRINIIGFPVGQTGMLTLNMWLEIDSQKIGEVYSYVLNVNHVQPS